MSKLKLLLLGGIFTLVGIFNFSNAYTFLVDKNTTFNGISTVGGFHTIGQLQKYSDSDVCVSVYFPHPGRCDGTRKLTVLYFVKSITTSTFFECAPVSKFFRSSDSSIPVQISFGADNCEYEITFTQKSSTEGLSPNGVNDITPAVNGVKTTVNQIIPLMVFIGIGVLVVTLGFIAIRWLVNWLGGKIRSVFKSKRG